MIADVYGALAALCEAVGYGRSTDPFTFDGEPRAGGDAYYLDPPVTRQTVGYLGGAALDVLTVSIWISAEAGHDARAVGARLAGDLDRLRGAVCDLDVGDVAHVRPTVETMIRPRRDGSTFMVGRLRVEVELERDCEPVAGPEVSPL